MPLQTAKLKVQKSRVLTEDLSPYLIY